MVTKRIFKTIRITLTILVVIILGAVILQRLSNNKISFLGYGIYTIISESMKPDYEIGDMIVSKETAKENLKVGDVIVYKGSEGEFTDKVVTHRIYEMGDKIITKGDNNEALDPAIEYEQVYGKVVHKMFVLSIFSKLMNNNYLFYIIVFVPFTLLVFFDIKGIIKEKKELEAKKAMDEIEILDDDYENINVDSNINNQDNNQDNNQGSNQNM